MMIKNSWKFIKEYFYYNKNKWPAIFLLLTVVAMELFVVYLNVQFNSWNNDFYNSLQEMNADAFYYNLKKFTILALVFVGITGYKSFFNQKLQNNWRKWMTEKYLDRWLSLKSFYGLSLKTDYNSENIDQRIAEDINNYVKHTSILTLDLLGTVTTFFSFITILWTLSADASFTVLGYAVTIPNYLVWSALIYAVLGTVVAHKIGRPLIALRFNQEKREANFRYSLMRLKENSESVALYSGETVEKEKFINSFGDIFSNFGKIIKRQKYLAWWSNYFAQIAVIFPYLVNAPRFFSGSMTLGGLMQVSSAFDKVQTSLSWIVDTYSSLATYNAIVQRLSGLDAAMTEWELEFKNKKISIISHDKYGFDKLSVSLPDGRIIIKNQSMIFEQGKHYLISGKSGVGKSTLIRGIANIWPHSSGSILKGKRMKDMFVAQNSYMPHGTLLDCMTYPQKNSSKAQKNRIISLMKSLDLESLINNIDHVDDWTRILSGGQKQKVAFIRAIISKSDIIFFDESTSNMDEDSESVAYKLVKKFLPNTTIVSIGHRKSIEKFHDFYITLKNNKISLSKIV